MRFKSKRKRWLLAGLILAGVVAGGLAYRHHQRFRHLAVHQPGMIYRCAWLDPDALAEVIGDYQIRTVVNLCKPGELGLAKWEAERRAVADAGARLVELEMPNTVDPSHPLIEKHIKLLGDADNYPLLVHCQHGITRTAKLLSIYDIVYRGMSGGESLAAQPLFGRDDHNVHVRTFVANFQKLYGPRDFAAARKKLKALAN